MFLLGWTVEYECVKLWRDMLELVLLCWYVVGSGTVALR